jgi:hypothetical protein
MNPALVISVISLLISFFSFFYFRAYLKRRTGQERILADFREEVNKLLAEIDNITDRDATLVEERVSTLKTLLADIDKRIAVYAREIERKGREEKVYTELGKNRFISLESLPNSGKIPETSRQVEMNRVPVLAGEGPQGHENRGVQEPAAYQPGRAAPVQPSTGETPVQQEEQIPVFVVREDDPPEESSEKGNAQKSPQGRSKEGELRIAKQAAALAKAGFASNVIASRLGVSITEVEMAVALFGPKSLS